MPKKDYGNVDRNQLGNKWQMVCEENAIANAICILFTLCTPDTKLMKRQSVEWQFPTQMYVDVYAVCVCLFASATVSHNK